MKNKLLTLLVRFLQLFIPKSPQNNRILIVSTTALGDTLWATPAIESLRKSLPNAYIAVLTSPIGMEVLAHNPHINDLFIYPKRVNPFYIWKSLYSKRFDTVLIFHASQRLIPPLCALLGATRILGTATLNKGLDHLLTEVLPNGPQHEILRRLDYIAAIGATPTTQLLSFYLQPHEQLAPRPRWIALHPGSKDTFKRWPYFAKLGQLLKQSLSCEILITGTPAELPLMQTLAAQIPGAHIDNPNRSLREFAATLNQVDLLISNDTGPVHLACALNRPVIGIYSSTDPALCGPHQAPNARAISKSAPCTPCLKRKCRQPFCFLQISPEEVLLAAKDFF